MNWLFLRGRMERHSECKWNTLDECTDMWTHLFSGLVGEEDTGTVLYSNGKRNVIYRENLWERWMPEFGYFYLLNAVREVKTPDIIVARGGFKEYVPLLKKYPKAKKIYYGANHGCIPKDGIKYDLIMCDSEEQVRKCKKHGLNGQLFIKPAAPQFFPRTVEKKYDIGFSAIWPKDKRKNVSWVHKTCPKYLKVLQMGHACKAPGNVSVKLIDHDKMPRAISKCKVIIAPYMSDDSCPRIIPEALACGVPVVALDTCQFWYERYKKSYAVTQDKKHFWKTVEMAVGYNPSDYTDINAAYKEHLSIPVAAKHLRSLII